jgi:hypothetical protein
MYSIQSIKTDVMGQNKLNKKDEKTTTASNPNIKNSKGDTERSSNQGRKAASGGSKATNNKGQAKGA